MHAAISVVRRDEADWTVSGSDAQPRGPPQRQPRSSDAVRPGDGVDTPNPGALGAHRGDPSEPGLEIEVNERTRDRPAVRARKRRPDWEPRHGTGRGHDPLG